MENPAVATASGSSRALCPSGATNELSNQKVTWRGLSWNGPMQVSHRIYQSLRRLNESTDQSRGVGFSRQNSRLERNGRGACARLHADTRALKQQTPELDLFKR